MEKNPQRLQRPLLLCRLLAHLGDPPSQAFRFAPPRKRARGARGPECECFWASGKMGPKSHEAPMRYRLHDAVNMTRESAAHVSEIPYSVNFREKSPLVHQKDFRRRTRTTLKLGKSHGCETD